MYKVLKLNKNLYLFVKNKWKLEFHTGHLNIFVFLLQMSDLLTAALKVNEYFFIFVNLC